MSFNWKKNIPHFIAVLVFLIVAVIYCKPALEGKVLQQSDLTQWKGMSKDQQNYKDANGHAPLWSNGMFSGMPGYLIMGDTNNDLPYIFISILSLHLPEPISFFFLSCICFYFLSQVLRINPWVGIMGALTYAYATYNPVVIWVGQETKMFSIALMPGFIASLILINEKRYWLGAASTALFTSALISQNHYQIIYYCIIIAVFLEVAFAIRTIRNKEYKHLIIAFAITGAMGIVGILSNAVVLLTNYEYTQQTIRGGSTIASDGKEESKTGLNNDYAFSYSMGITEPLVMMVPRMFGGSSDHPEISETSSKAIAELQSMPQELAQQLGYPRYYWGGIVPSTSGPPYVGAIICFLAIAGFFILDTKYKWWILGCCALTIVMSWGGYFSGFNGLLLKYLPMYNKFRAPSMIIVVPTLLFGMMAVLTLDKIVYNTKNLSSLIDPYKKALMTTGGIIIVLFMLYLTFDYLGEQDKEILKQVNSLNEQVKTPIKAFFSALQDDRKQLFLSDIFRSLAFIAIAAGMLWFFIKGKLKPAVVTTVIALFAFIDVMAIDTKYLNSDDFIAKEDFDNSFFKASPADVQILQDKSYYRVLDLRQGVQGAFNGGALTAYFHKTIGGYHPAKLSIYQDLIEKQLYKFPNCIPVINMLNTKYVIADNNQAQLNPGALGNAWFVNEVKYYNSPKDVMTALDSLDTRNVLVTEKSFEKMIKAVPNADSTATIQMLSNHNDTVVYKTKSATEQAAVFSEVYYDKGWNAYVDSKKTDIAKVNYVLRGLMVPAGEHTIEFRFEPESHETGWNITKYTTILILLIVVISAFFAVRPMLKPAKASV